MRKFLFSICILCFFINYNCFADDCIIQEQDKIFRYGAPGAVIGFCSAFTGNIVGQTLSKGNIKKVDLGDAAISGIAGAVAGATQGPVGIVWGFNSALSEGMVHGVYNNIKNNNNINSIDYNNHNNGYHGKGYYNINLNPL